MTTTCRTCVTPIGYINCPTGGWWAHEKHPADNHDAVPAAWVDNDPLMETIAETVWAHCRTEGTSLVVDDPRNIAATAAAVARHFAAAVPVPPSAGIDRRAQLLDALDFAYCQGLGFDTPEALLDAYDASRGVPVPPPADQTAVLRAADIAEDVAERLRKRHEFERSTGALDVMTELRRVAAEEQPAETQPQEPPTEAEIVRAHVLTVHQIGEQLAGIETWMWEHLANVRATERPAVGEQPETQEADRG